MRTYASVYYINEADAMPDQPRGWYYAFGCDPTCLPESLPNGPFGDERLAIAEARAEMEMEGWPEVEHLEWQLPDEEEMFSEVARPFDANKLACPLEEEFTEDWDRNKF